LVEGGGVLPLTWAGKNRRWWNRARRWIWLPALVLLLAGCGGSGPGLKEGISVGQRAPDFRLEALDGSQVSLGDHRGQVVLINFWATWCDPCLSEIPDLEAVYQARRDDGFTILGVNSHETRGAIEPFVAQMDVSYPMLIDENGQVAKMYRPPGLPMSLLVDCEGIIRVRHLGLLTSDQLQEYLAGLLP
jgi:peroxiredoxin